MKSLDVLVDVYESRIGRASTEDEALGYWMFVAGVILGFIGLSLVLLNAVSGRTLSVIGVSIACVSLILLLVGPIVRLPLTKRSRPFIYLGSLLSLAGIAWFASVHPEGWSSQFNNNESLIIGLYSIGILVISISGIVTPLLFSASKQKEEADEKLEEMTSFRNDLQNELNNILESQSQFELFQDEDNEYRWRLKHKNGNIIADSNQGYSSKQKAQQGLTAVRRDAIGATVVDIDHAEDINEEIIHNAEPQSSFEIYEDKGGEYRWRLRHTNGNILCDSGQGYKSKQSRNNSVENISKYVLTGKYLKIDPVAFEIFIDNKNMYRWRLIHKNGQIMAKSSIGYKSREKVDKSIDTVREQIHSDMVEIYEDKKGQYRWKLKDNGNSIAGSVRGFSDKSKAENSLDRVRNNINKSERFEIGPSSFELYEDEEGKYRWRLRHKNGNILCDSGQGYSSRSGSINGINSVKRDILTSRIKEV